MTITRLNSPNIKNMVSNLEKKVYSSEQPKSDPSTEAVNALAETANVPEKVEENKEENVENKSAAELRAERRDAFKRAADIEQRARQMEKTAKEKLAAAQHFEQVAKSAKEDPIAVAKALGLDPTEFLRQYQNQMFGITDKEEKTPLTPEQETKAVIDKLVKEREEEKVQQAQLQSQLIRNNYISSKILPVLTANKDKFELLNYNNIEASASFIYDLMDAHYRETGEEWDAVSVAEEYEAAMAAELEEKIASVKKINKFSKYFREEQKTEEVATPPAKSQTQLGATKKTLSDKLTSAPAAVSVQRQRVALSDRQSRIERTLERLAAKDKV